MSAPDLKTFLRIAFEYFDVLEAVFDAPRGMRETAIRERIQSTTGRSVSPSHVFQQMREHGLIEPLPEATAAYETTMRVTLLFRDFRREQVLSTPKAIQSHLDHIEEQRERLAQRSDQQSLLGAQRALESIDTELETIRTLSRTNREAILHRVTELRASPTTHTVRERFEIVNEMMEDHIQPLTRIIETRGAFEALFNRLKGTLDTAADRFVDEPALTREIESTLARLRRVRTNVFQNFEAARNEVLPLFERNQQDDAIVRGASRMLKHVHHHGVDALDLPSRMQLGRFQIRTVFHDDGLRSFLVDMRDFEPAPPLPVSAPPPVDQTPVPNRADVVDRVRAASPLPDVMAWLVATYADVDTRHVLAAYRHVLQSPRLDLAFDAAPHAPTRAYRHGRHVLHARPLGVRAASV